MATVIIEKDLCKGCGLCVDACRLKVLDMDKTKINNKGFNPATVILDDKCVGCGNCAIMCPDSVIKIIK